MDPRGSAWEYVRPGVPLQARADRLSVLEGDCSSVTLARECEVCINREYIVFLGRDEFMLITDLILLQSEQYNLLPSLNLRTQTHLGSSDWLKISNDFERFINLTLSLTHLD